MQHLYRLSFSQKTYTRDELYELRREIDAVLNDYSNELIEDRIIQIVCDYFGIRRDVLLSKARPERIAWPRQIAMTLIYENTEFSTNEVKRIFGKKDHGTICYAKTIVEQRGKDCIRDARAISAIRKAVTNALQSLSSPNGGNPPEHANGHGEPLAGRTEAAGVQAV